MEPNVVDSSKPTSVYFGGIVFVALLALVVGQFPALWLSTYWELANKREISAGLFLVFVLVGTATVKAHASRAENPWKVPQSMVSILFMTSVLTASLALIVAK